MIKPGMEAGSWQLLQKNLEKLLCVSLFVCFAVVVCFVLCCCFLWTADVCVATQSVKGREGEGVIGGGAE